MNIAILGAGDIAAIMATTLQPLKDVTCYAVAARDKNRAQVFADKFGFAKAYGSYNDMLEDPDVQLDLLEGIHGCADIPGAGRCVFLLQLRFAYHEHDVHERVFYLRTLSSLDICRPLLRGFLELLKEFPGLIVRREPSLVLDVVLDLL